MRLVTDDTNAAWQAAFKGGDTRPVVRATIQKMDVKLCPYKRPTQNGVAGNSGVFASAIFGQDFQPVELPNLASVKWTRSVDQDVAQCDIVIWNTERLAVGEVPPDDVSFDKPGYMTFNRGVDPAAVSRWGYAANGWRDLLVPDRIIRTFEGYGFDPSVTPEADPNLYPSGVWLIDDVEYSADGTIKVSCRDMGRVLLDQIFFPPVVPFSEYPFTWIPDQTVPGPPKLTTSSGWKRPVYETDSGIPYIGKGFTDGSFPYVDSTGAVLGHHGRYAFDTNVASYWLSVGNEASWSSAFEYVQGAISGAVHAVQLKTWGGPYLVYVSLWDGSKWLGSRKIPYRARVVDTNADIPFVDSFTAGKSTTTVRALPKAYAGITKIRLTFTDLYNSGIGEFKYRAGCYDIQVNESVVTSTPTTMVIGNMADYTDIVKWVCAWGGFFWPDESTGFDYLTNADGTTTNVVASTPDPVLPTGRVWGDFEGTGTNSLIPLTPDIWDKKPLMDSITYVRNIVNFIFFIDETGGVVWRSPNIWQEGNYIGGGLNDADIGRTTEGRTSTVYVIDEQDTILGLRPKLSSRAMRERYFVANTDGAFGAVSPPIGSVSYNPYPSGLRRVAGWTDQHFSTQAECQIMADLIAVRSMFEYRTNVVTVPGNPGLQVDDQVRIMERVTGETYLHYVRGITSDWDAKSGKWTYEIETHWLGLTPFSNWAFDPSLLSAETKQYLTALGKI
jgi:hypothetical protein